MKPLPRPLTLPTLLTLEAARWHTAQAHQALDRVFEQNARPDDLLTALEAAIQASTQESYACREAPSWN